MPRHRECRVLSYPAELVYGIVADVERYPDFLPGMIKANIVRSTDQGFLADLTIGYQFFQDTYRSEVILTPLDRIDVNYVEGPFKHLYNHWIFKPISPQSVEVNFLIDFEFQSALFQGMIQKVFTQVVKSMVTAFEDRARTLSLRKRG